MIALQKIAAGVAFPAFLPIPPVLTTVLGSVLQQATVGSTGLDPALIASYGAIGALFSLYVWSTKGRTERCESREDKLLNSDTDKTAALRDVATTVVKVSEAADKAVESGRRTEQVLVTVREELAETKRLLANVNTELSVLETQVQRDLDERNRKGA